MPVVDEEHIKTADAAGPAAGEVEPAAPPAAVLIDGDVDPAGGDIDAELDVHIKGTVRSTVRVRSKGSVAVEGAIESACVTAGASIIVHGGIADQGEGSIEAGGDITAKYCEGAKLRAGGNINIIHEAMHSRIHAAGHVDISEGAVIGGYTYARERATINALGNEAGVPTYVAVGIDPAIVLDARNAAADMNRKQQTITRIRTEIQPLLNFVRRLTPQQREKATELIYEADIMEQQLVEQKKAVDANLAASSPKAQPILRVTGRIFAKATVIFGDRKTTFDSACRGPLKILQRPVKGVEQIVLIDEVSGASRVLPGRSSLDQPVWDERAAKPTEAASP